MSKKIRIDKWLWAVRIYKTRSLANNACNSGKVKLNNIKIKPSKTIHTGDLISLQKGYIKHIFKVKGLINKRVSATIARQNFIDLTSEEEKIKKTINLFEPHFKREKGTGRPTKRDRRQMEKYVDKFKNQ